MGVHLNTRLRDRSEAIGSDDLQRLYREALVGDFHAEILRLISERLPGCAVLFIAQDTVDHTGNYLRHCGLDLDATRSFSVDITAQSVWFRQQWQEPVGSVFRQNDLIDPDEFKTTKFYRHWLMDRGHFEQAVGTVFMRQGTRQHVLEVRFPERDEQLYSQRVRKLLRDLAPHLQNAAQTAQLKARFDKARSELDQTLGLIPFPAAIVDTECRVEKLNPLAENMLRNCQALILGADERLHGVETDDEIQLKRAVQEVGTGQANETRWLRFMPNERQAGLVLTLIHLDPRRRHVQADSAHRVHNRDLVAIIAQHRDESSKLSHDMLWQTFGLTTKESELAAALLQGESIGEIAVKKSLSKQTLRNQLGAVMRKTGTRRQVDLVASLLRLSLSSPI
ncbi:MAG: LuxR C-terminal-related transcriptional regulator [Maritimibacter sp.]